MLGDSMKESDIIFEMGAYWVLKTRDSYDVMKNVGTHSVLDSAYPRNDDGLSIAEARCNYLTRRSE